MPGASFLPNAPDLTYSQKHLVRQIISAAHSACDPDDLDSALQLLRVVDLIVKPKESLGRDMRQMAQHAIMAHERLWLLRFPEVG